MQPGNVTIELKPSQKGRSGSRQVASGEARWLREAWKDEMRKERVRSRGQALRQPRERGSNCTRWMRRYDDDLDSGGEA